MEECRFEMKNILITGEHSYIGTSVETWLNNVNQAAKIKGLEEPYSITTISVLSDEHNHGAWESYDFSAFDTVFDVAGIAHADIGNVKDDVKKLYYRVNTDLTLLLARKAQSAGCKQFIYMSSMIIYGDVQCITKDTQPKPANFYGDSKWQADQRLRQMNTDTFHVAVLRPPMIYGKGSKGNYPILAKMASRLPFFPVVKNKRSMLYIDNLTEFIRLLIDNNDSGAFFPQNSEYSNTSQMVKMIANIKGHKILMVYGISWMVYIMMRIPGKIGGLVTKAFGDSCYEKGLSEYKVDGRVVDYRVHNLSESIVLTEKV